MPFNSSLPEAGTLFTPPALSPEGVIPQANPGDGGDASVISFPDGTAVVGSREPETIRPRPVPEDHDQNLALVLDEQELSEIGHSLKQAVDEDKQSQEQFFESVAEIIKYLGLTLTTEEDKNDLPFTGASSIYSSALFESALDIVSSAKGTIFPSTNMVDTVILGEASDDLQGIAYRKKEFFNYYFDQVDHEFRKEALRTIFWATLTGSAYKKVYICPVLGRPVSHFIPVEDFLVNRAHSSHMAASRKTHILKINEREFQIRVQTGMYRDLKVRPEDDASSEESVIQETLDELSGYDRYLARDRGIYTIYECHVDYRIKGDVAGDPYDLPLPYIIALDKESGKVLSIRRNWKQDDFLKKKRDYFVNYSLLPSLDGEGYGLVNYAGRLSEAATSLTRQLINAGTYANFPGGVYQSGLRLENNNLRPSPGEFVPIQTGGMPVGDCVQPLPYREPSSALADLKNQIEDNIRKPSAIVNQKISDMAPRAPQGSVLAMLENLQKVPNAILQNFHESFARELDLFNQRFGEWLPEGQPYPFMVPGGQHAIMKADFEAEIQVMPSSDPSRKNSTHRFMLSEIVINQAKEAPDLHNMPFAFRYFYKNLGLTDEDITQLLSPPKQAEQPPTPQDPVSTMMALMQGQPTTAAPWQDHAAYIQLIDLWMQQNQENPHLQEAQALKAQHEALKYMVDVYAQLGMNPPEDPSQLTPAQQNELAVAVAQIKTQEAQAAQAAASPPEPPLDPAKVELEAAHLQAQSAHEKHALERIKLEMEHEKMQREFALKEQEFDLKAQIEALKQANAEQKAQIDAFKVEHEQLLKERECLFREQEKTQEHQETHEGDELPQEEGMPL